MNSLLLIIDLQKVFINKNTRKLPKKINKIINDKKYNKIAFTRFNNFDDSIYVKKLKWKKCINVDDKKIMIDIGNNKVFNKYVYSAVNEEFIKFIKENNITNIYLCGIDIECCVLKTAIDLFELGYNVYVLKDYCTCTHGIIRKNNALKIIKRCIGKDNVI